MKFTLFKRILYNSYDDEYRDKIIIYTDSTVDVPSYTEYTAFYSALHLCCGYSTITAAIDKLSESNKKAADFLYNLERKEVIDPKEVNTFGGDTLFVFFPKEYRLIYSWYAKTYQKPIVDFTEDLITIIYINL